MTNDFKQECKNPAYKNRLCKIELEDGSYITNSDNLSSIEINDSCISDGNILGNANSKTLNIKTLNPQELNNQKVQINIGIKYADTSEEYIKMGNYTITSESVEKTAQNGEYKAFDDLNKLNQIYSCGINDFSEVTLKDFYTDVCNQLGLVPKRTEFLNSNLPVKGNPFTNNETCGIVIKNIGQVACSFIDIDWEVNEIDLCWLDSDVSETFSKSNYSELEKNEVIGPINSLVIKESAIEGENVVREDTDSIEENGEFQISIEDNYFLYTEELRTLAIDNIWDRIQGLTYVNCKLTSYTGTPYLKRGNKISIQDNDGTYFDTYVLSHTFTYDGTFSSVIESPSINKSQTNIKNKQSVSAYFRKVERVCNKIDGKIEDTIIQVNDNTEKISQTIMDINSIQNMFQITGGNNLIKDSQKLLDDEGLWEYGDPSTYSLFPGSGVHPMETLHPIEYYFNEPVYVGGYDATLIGKTVSIAKLGISNGKMSTSTKNITGLIIDNMYTLSFKITNETNTNAKIKLIGNGNVVYQESFDDTSKMEEVVFSFVANTSNYTLEIQSTSTTEGFTYIYDLMLNKGDVQTWEPSAGEIVSTTLKLSQLGFQVYSTGSEIATLMTSQGFDIRRFQNGTLYEIVTTFDKDGFKSKKGTLEELEIGNFEYKTINYQNYETLVLYKKEGDS